MEVTIPLDTKSPQYNQEAAELLELKKLTLQSRATELGSTQALGLMR